MTNRSAPSARKRSRLDNISTRDVGLIAGALVAGVAAVASYTHMRELASRHGEVWLSYLVPLSVDGMIVLASLVIISAGRRHSRRPWLAWLTLIAGVLVSLAANVVAASPDLISRLVAAWPPLAFAVSFEHLIHLLRNHPTRGGDDRQEGGGQGGEDLAEDLVTQAASVVARLEEAGVELVGRKRLARELGVSEHQARQLLRQVRPNGDRPLQSVGDES